MKRRSSHRLIAFLFLAGGFSGHANPTGGEVAAGAATIAGQGTNAVTINQGSNTAIINWQSFSIGSGELTKFIQPASSSATLNRVLGGQTSFINGTLSANGQVYLLNGNGIIVGPGGVINTAGFIGSTRDISDSDFLSGTLHFVGGGKAGVKNFGTINALGGDVVLIGNTVENGGTINATGTAGLIAGDDVLLAQNNPDGSTITVNPVSVPTGSPAKVGVRNTGSIAASSAELKAANGNIYALAIQNTGIVRATTVKQQGGHIYLTSDSGTIANSGTLDASATVVGGQGGAILVKSAAGKIVQSGRIVARGGRGGAGGNAEVSAAQLDFTGAVDLTALDGKTGDLLLDPTMLTVVAGNGGATEGGPTNYGNDPSLSTIGAGTVDAILEGTNGVGSANLTLGAAANITVNAAIGWNAPTTLSLITTGTGNGSATSIVITAAIDGENNSDPSHEGSLTIHTANAGDSVTDSGAVNVSSFILQNGSWVQNVAPNVTTGVSQLPGFVASNDFEIQGGSFLRANGGNGSTTLVSGTSISTPYLISDVYGLQGINSPSYLSSSFAIYQGGTIDASVTANWNKVNGTPTGFVPIGTASPYEGTFGAGGGEIENLTINLPTTDNVGLFSVIGASGYVEYVNLTSPSIKGRNNVGAFAGQNLGTIFNTSFTDYSGNISITGNTDVGFIAGQNQGNIQYCYVNSGTLSGTTTVGGIVGLNGNYLSGGSSGGTVNGVTAVGGIAGENDGVVDSASNYATVNGTTEVGGIAGLNTSTLSNDGNYGSVNGTIQVGGLAGLNTADGLIYSGIGGGSVTGSDTSSLQSIDVGDLVGQNEGSLISSFTTASSVVNGDLNVGGMVGYNTGIISSVPVPISDSGNLTSPGGSFNSGSVTGNASTIDGDTGDTDIGGVAGLNTGLITGSYNTGAVTGATNVGGVVGENQAQQQQNFESDNSFHAFATTNQPVFVLNTGVVQTCYNSGAVSASTGSSSNIGGLVGLNDAGSTVDTTYNIGTVTGSSGSTNVGGLIGDNFNLVQNSYNSGLVSAPQGATNVASLIGFDEDNATATNLYWDTSTSGGFGATNSNGTNTNPSDPNSALETNIGAVDSTTAYTIAGNVSGSAPGYGYFGTATGVGGTDGVYSIGTSPDSGGGASWYIIEGETRPILAMELSSNIQNTHQLQLVSANLSGSYYLSQNIGVTGTTGASEIWNSATGFVPIGADPSLNETPSAFTGNLNGENNTIDSLTIDRPEDNDVGLVGIYAGAIGNSISALNLTNLRITGDNNVGGIAGANVGTIQNVQIGNATDTSVVTGFGTGVGGITGSNGEGPEGPTGTVTEDVNYATVRGAQVDPPTSIGGLAGVNDVTGVVTQSINNGNVGSGFENNVGGLVGDNRGRVDDSYSTDSIAGNGTAFSRTVSGRSNVGGLVGYNETGAILETSYGTIAVSGNNAPTTGALIGTNRGIARHVYWENNNANSELPGIGTDLGQTTDVVGYSSTELTEMQNFAQGASPALWDFRPQNGAGVGIWGVNVDGYDYLDGNYVQGQINGGLPVLQWQIPVTTEVALTSGTYNYGTAPGYTATGPGASNLNSAVNSPNGPTLTVSDLTDRSAGSVHTVTISGTPTQYGYNIEYVNGAIIYDGSGNQTGVMSTSPTANTPGYTIAPAPLTITAASFTIPSGATIPAFTASYGPFAYGETASDLTGTLGFTVNPALSNSVGSFAIQPGGQSSSNYSITYVPGALTIVGSGTGNEENPKIATFESELTSITNQFGNDPFNGLDPLYFMSIPTLFGLEGDFLGAINNEGQPGDVVYISSTSSLRALSRLVTPGTGVVTIGDGFVIVGNPATGAAIYLDRGGQGIPPQALSGLRNVLSPSAYNHLLALIHGHP